MKPVLLKNRFASKMILTILLVILIPTLFISASFYMVSTSIVKSNVRESTIQIASQAADSLSFMLNAASDTSDLIYSDTKVQQAVRMKVTNYEQIEQNEKFINSTLNNIVYSSSFVKIIYLLRDQGTSWGSGTFSRYKLSRYQLHDFAWVNQAEAKDGELVWQGLQYDLFSGAGYNTDLVLPVGRVLKDFDALNNLGYILVDLNGKDLLDNISRIKLGQTGKFFVVDEQGRIMIDPDLAKVGKQVANPGLLDNIIGNKKIEFEFTQDGEPYYGVKQQLINGWYLLGIVPSREITEQLDALQRRIFYYFIVITLVAVLIGFFLANKVIRPVRQLTNQMRQVQKGDFKVRTEIIAKDEIGLMSRQFNKMLQQIEVLMAQVKDEQSKKQEAELRAVTHRINPHFLFNTLSTLRWLVKYHQTERAYEGISALIRLLEANMGKRGTFITISEELDIIEKYLEILELRYDLKFQLELSIDTEALSFHIPRMLLQPLVENAIFHGFVPLNRNGHIAITITSDQRSVAISVKDDGIGMEQSKLAELQNMEKAMENRQVGIGLRHVYESIALYYGNGSSMYVESSPDEGTAVQLRLQKTQDLAADR